MKKAKFTILIQARIHSKRLRGKILFSFFGEKVLERIIRIAKAIKINKEIFILTGKRERNSIIEKISKKHSIKTYFGEEKNVLKRFQSFVKLNKIENENIIRITSDNYLIQPMIVEKLAKQFVSENFDYGYILPLSHYSGEVFKGKILFLQNSKNKNNKEHVTFEMRKNKKFRILKLNSNFMNIDHKKFFTLDTYEDRIKMEKIQNKYKSLKNLNCINTIKKIQNCL